MTDTEKATLERRIDELCAEIERLRADQAHWELGNCPQCPNVVSLQEVLEQNAKLRELAQGLWFAAQYLGMNPDGATGSGFARQMRELGIEVDVTAIEKEE